MTFGLPPFAATVFGDGRSEEGDEELPPTTTGWWEGARWRRADRCIERNARDATYRQSAQEFGAGCRIYIKHETDLDDVRQARKQYATAIGHISARSWINAGFTDPPY